VSQVWVWILGGIARLLIAIKLAAAGIVGRVLATFGLTIVSFDVLLPKLKAFVLQFISGMPAQMVDFLGAIGLGQAMSMIFSALTIRLAWKVFIVPTSVADALQGAGQ
jgi:hypothetical protein